MSLPRGHLYEFGKFRLDTVSRRLLREGQIVTLTPKAVDLLVALIENTGRTVSKEELLKAVWPGTYVEEGNLTQNISVLRKALGVDAADGECILTVPREGYRFIAAVSESGNGLAGPEKEKGQRSWKPALAFATVLVVLALVYPGYRYFRSASQNPAPTFTQVTDLPGIELYPSLSPDGNTVAFARSGPTRWDIYVQRIGGNATNLTQDSGADNLTPAFSPDGNQIAFVSGNYVGRPNQSRRGLFVMGSTGESVRRVGDMCFDPSWSPDATEIVCSTINTGAGGSERPSSAPLLPNGQLWRVEVASGRHRVISSADAIHPDWSPHDKRIAYAGLVNGTMDVFTIPVEGGDPVPVTHGAPRNWDPRWAPDGRHVYFISDRGGRTNCGGWKSTKAAAMSRARLRPSPPGLP